MTRASEADPVRTLPSGPVVRVPLQSLTPPDSPRVRGEDYTHARVLAESETALPPVTVHRPTMRIVDGAHRVRAARLRGQSEIDVVFFDGDPEAAFVLAVTANITHGLPLTLEDRTNAATRIIGEYPEWSDRRIASVTGLSAATVAGIRRRSTARSAQSDTRVGTDGRKRPVNGAVGRRMAETLLRRQPDASVREVARAAGISPATAHDVRRRLARGEDALPPAQRAAPPDPATAPEPAARPDTATPDRAVPPSRPDPSTPAAHTVGPSSGAPGPRAEPGGARAPSRSAGRRADLERLSGDPALRSSDAGRILIRSLGIGIPAALRSPDLARTVPPHCRELVAALAEESATSWATLAARLRGLTEPDIP